MAVRNGNEEIDIHGRREKTESLVKTIKSSNLYPDCKKALQSFYELNQGVRINTQHKDLYEAYNYLLWHNKPSVESITKADNQRWWAYWLKRYNEGEIKYGTVEKVCWLTKKFVRRHYGLKKKRYPEQIDFIELPPRPQEEDEIELPTQKQIKDIIENHALATHPKSNGKFVRAVGALQFRNQFLLSLLNDVGCRIQEAIGMNVADLKQAEGKNYLVLRFKVSKSKPRRNLGYLCKPYATKWLQNYLYDDPESTPLFPDRLGKRMTYGAARQLVLRAFASAGVTLPERKATSVFRHCLASRLDWNSDMKDQWFGWTKRGTKRMSANYSHLKTQDFEKPYFESNANNCMMPKECAICGTSGARGFCEQCGGTLSQDNVLTITNKKQALGLELLEAAQKDTKAWGEIANILAGVAIKQKMGEKMGEMG